jgi:hypothetical protein
MSGITEKSVSALWLSGRLLHFNDDSGHSIEVICPGRASTRGGCDFQDVIIKVDGEKTVGDVEVHLTSDLWQRHGHHRDAAYNGNILHVSMWQRGFLPVRLQDGRVLSTVILAQYIKNAGELLQGISVKPVLRCPHLVSSGKKADRVIVEAGLSRFQQKSARFAQALGDGDPEQMLYKAICRALGYARNVKPFETLAGRVTAEMVRNCAAGSLPAKYNLLLGAAGLRPAHKNSLLHAPGGGISGRQTSRRHIFAGIQPMEASDWVTATARPSNHPVLRIAGLCHLLHRYEKGGLVSSLAELVYNALPQRAAFFLDRAFTVEGNGRFDSLALIGTGRAREIVVNAVLPFISAYGASIDNRPLEEKARQIISSYPSLPHNELTRYMIGLLGNQAYGACRHQGLLHIYHNWCRTRECGACPVVMLRKTAPV